MCQKDTFALTHTIGFDNHSEICATLSILRGRRVIFFIRRFAFWFTVWQLFTQTVVLVVCFMFFLLSFYVFGLRFKFSWRFNIFICCFWTQQRISLFSFFGICTNDDNFLILNLFNVWLTLIPIFLLLLNGKNLLPLSLSPPCFITFLNMLLQLIILLWKHPSLREEIILEREKFVQTF